MYNDYLARRIEIKDEIIADYWERIKGLQPFLYLSVSIKTALDTCERLGMSNEDKLSSIYTILEEFRETNPDHYRKLIRGE